MTVDIKEIESLVVDACDDVDFSGEIWSNHEQSLNRRDEKHYLRKMKKAYRKALNRQRKQNIEMVEKSYRKVRKNFLLTSQTTKVLIGFIFGNCTIVEIYAMVVMYRLGDLSALSTLIASCITEALSFAVYGCKSYLETREEKRIEIGMANTAIPEIEPQIEDNIIKDHEPDPDELLGDECGHEEIEPGVCALRQ